MKWFKLHAEVRNDAKLRALNGEQYRVWLNLLCYSSEMNERGCIDSVDRDLLAIECAAGDVDLLNETVEKLIKLRIVKVTIATQSICFVNFSKRQYENPSSTPARVQGRVNKFREKSVTATVETPIVESITPSNGVVTNCNGFVTGKNASETDTDTETDTDSDTEKESIAETPLPQKATSPRADTGKALQLIAFAEFYASYPVKKAKQDAERAWLKISPSETLRTLIMAGLATAKSSQEWSDDGGKYIPHPATFLNHCRWEDTYRPIGSRPAAQQQRANGTVHPNTMQGVIDDTARAIRAEEARQEATRQNALMLTADRKGLFQ